MLENILREKKYLIELTQQLISIPSPTGEERQLAEFIVQNMDNMHLDNVIIDEIGNVVAWIDGGLEGPSILLNCHMDTVPVGNKSEWGEYDPIGGEIDESGYIHGRGASDDKGGIALLMTLMKSIGDLRQKGINFAGRLIFSAVVHEEAVEMFGMEHLCRHTLPAKGLSFDLMLLAEPTNLDLWIGHRGKIEISIKTGGKAAHASTPNTGVNAFEKILPLLKDYMTQREELQTEHPKLGKTTTTITRVRCLPENGSTIPYECEVLIDQRYLPGEELELVMKPYEKLIADTRYADPNLDIQLSIRKVEETSYTGFTRKVTKHHPAWLVDDTHEYVLQAKTALNKIGQYPDIGYFPGGTDGGMVSGILGIPTIGYSGQEFDYIHTNDEKVSIDMLYRSLEGYYAIVCDFFGID